MKNFSRARSVIDTLFVEVRIFSSLYRNTDDWYLIEIYGIRNPNDLDPILWICFTLSRRRRYKPKIVLDVCESNRFVDIGAIKKQHLNLGNYAVLGCLRCCR